MKTKTSRAPKIKIDSVDLKSFLLENLEIDPFWEDVYNPKKSKK